jgi:hypothetical protein
MTPTTTPPAPARRARWIHHLAWIGSVLSLGILFTSLFLPDRGGAWLVAIDLALTVFFVLEFFTRSGLRQQGPRYIAWRWFDFPAMVPILWLAAHGWLVHPVWFWIVLVLRLGRAIDRTLGDGYFLRQIGILIEGVEEEISDRVVVQVLTRVQAELADAKFGHVAAQELRKNRDPVLKRIYQEQTKDSGFVSAVAHATGLQSALERAEARIYDSIVEMVGSAETDTMISDIITQTLRKAEQEMGQKTWRRRLGVRPSPGLTGPEGP